MIIETCPNCGSDLFDYMLASNPPIPKKECHACGWSWTGKREEVIRVPFGGNSYNSNHTDYLGVHDNTITTLNTPYIVGKKIDGAKENTISNEQLNNLKRELSHFFVNDNFEQPACVTCPSNPKNGGDGICFCTLGQRIVY